jgi:hypothetical protein
VGREAGNLVSKSLCLDLADVIDDSLIYMEVVGQPAKQTRPLSSAQDKKRFDDGSFWRVPCLQHHTYFP